MFWRFPALILILLLSEKKPLFHPKKDPLVLFAAFAALVATGFFAALAADKTGFSPPMDIPQPVGLLGWIGVILFSLSIGALEEAYFRLYLPLRILELFPARSASAEYSADLGRTEAGGPDRTGHTITVAFVLSGLTFALCHAYEGPWGIANALLASFVLSFAYIKSSSFPGIALAHGLYNVFVFLTSANSLQ